MTATENVPAPASAKGTHEQGVIARAKNRTRTTFETLVRKLPIPEVFWARDEDLELIGPMNLVSYGACAVYVVTALTFIGAAVFYADSSQWITETIISDEIAIAGCECTPLGPDPFYGLDWTYDQCASKVRPLTEANIDFSNAELASGASQICNVETSPGSNVFVNVGCNCTGSNNVFFNPFGDEQTGRGLWPKLPNARTTNLFTYVNNVENSAQCTSSWNKCVMMARAGDKDLSGVVGSCECFNVSRSVFLDLFNKTIEYLYDNDVCAFTKANLPYKCIKTARAHPFEIMALASNNAAFMFTCILALVCILIKRARKDESQKRSVERHWVTKLPLPEQFYDDEQLEFISDHFVVAVLTLIVAGAAAGAFGALYVYFGSSANFEKEVILTGDWEMSGYTCSPLTTDNAGFGVNYTFTKCLEKLRYPVTESALDFNVRSTGPGSTTYEAKYIPFEDSDEGLNAQLWKNFPRPDSVFTTHNAASYMMEFWDPPSANTWWIGSPSARIKSLANPAGGTWNQTMKDDAVSVWQHLMEMLTPAGACAFAKKNPPYQCTREGPPDVLTRLSLAYGNAKLFFTGLCAFFALLVKRHNSRSPAESRVTVSKDPKRAWKSRVPLVEKFYREEDLDLLASPKATFGATVLLYSALAIVFALSLSYYAKKDILDTTIEGTSSKEGYECIPLRYDAWYGQNWTYAECVDKLVMPTAESSGLNELVHTYRCSANKYCSSRASSESVAIRFRPWGRNFSSYRYFDGINPTNATFDTFFATRQTDFSSYASATLVASDFNDAGITLELKDTDAQYLPAITSATVTSFTSIYNELGAERMCAWTKLDFPFRCTKITKLPGVQVLSLASANTGLFGVGLCAVLTFALRRISVERQLP